MLFFYTNQEWIGGNRNYTNLLLDEKFTSKINKIKTKVMKYIRKEENELNECWDRVIQYTVGELY